MSEQKGTKARRHEGTRGDREATLSGRELATRAVAEALGGGRYVAETLANARAGVDAREGAFAQEAALGAVRHAVTLEHVLSAVARYDPRRVEPAVRALLLVAAYQIIWMDRVPVFAAVDESVSLARRTGRSSRGLRSSGTASGMVNAILRRLAGAIEARRGGWTSREPRCVRVDFAHGCWFREPVLPAAEVGCAPGPLAAHIAASAGELPGRFAELVERHGMEAAEGIAWASQGRPPVVLNRNSLSLDQAAFVARVNQEFGGAAEVMAAAEGRRAPEAAWVTGAAGLAQSSLLREGLAYVQDATSREAALLLAARPGESVLDLCAAPGGKAATIALAMENRGRLVASDIDEARLERVRDNVHRLGLSCVQARSAAELSAAAGGEAFDAAIADVPCSNTGVIARRPEARFRLSERSLSSLRTLQAQLISQAANQVRPGGRLVYSTCSIEPAENESIVAEFLELNPGWRCVDERLTLPHWGQTGREWRDGGYAALLRRQ